MRLLFVLLFISASAVLCAQSFPKQCEGTWKGTMQLWNNGQIGQTIDVELYVNPFGGEYGYWTWRTTYFPSGQDTSFSKDYTMVEIDSAKGIYSLDEGDGIKLSCYAYGNKLYSTFSVGKDVLSGIYELRGNELIFEVTSGKKIKGKKSEVSSYSTDFVQRVVLTKQE